MIFTSLNRLKILLTFNIFTIYSAYADTLPVSPTVPNYLLQVRMDRKPYGFYNPNVEFKGNVIRYGISSDNDTVKINFHSKQYTFQMSKLIAKATNAWQTASLSSGKPLLNFEPANSSNNVNLKFIVMNKVIDGLRPEITATNVQPNQKLKYKSLILDATPYARVYLFTDNLKYTDDFSYNYLHNLIFQSQVSDNEILEFLLLWTLEHTIGHILGLRHAPYDAIASAKDTKHIMHIENISNPSIPIMINNAPNMAAAIVYMTKLSAHLGRRLVLSDLEISPQEAAALKTSIQ
ncbi:MAG: hypothetical protein K0R14_6 [Burkholderiales bacterium]|jgi:hypothetical protein|nr:hypothetical protein [Burkholderiales bacterium]